MTDIERVLQRIISVKQSVETLESISRRLLEIEPSLERLSKDYSQLVESLPSSPFNNRAAELKKLRLLVEEIRIVLDEVESETDALDARVTVIENLRDRAQ
jgi:hypothetical protein